jgi:septal ring factor EnvC (AmiA/AmiB activator)
VDIKQQLAKFSDLEKLRSFTVAEVQQTARMAAAEIRMLEKERDSAEAQVRACEVSRKEFVDSIERFRARAIELFEGMADELTVFRLRGSE